MTTYQVDITSIVSSSGSFSVVGTGTILDALTDIQTSTYLDGADSFVVLCGMGSSGIPDSHVIKDFQYEFQALWANADPVECRLYSRDGVHAIPNTTRNVRVATTSIASFASPAVALTLSVAEKDDLYMRLHVTAAMNIYEANMYMTAVAPPVVSLDAITDPYEDSTVVPITFSTTSFDNDGGEIVRYQVRAFAEDDHSPLSGVDPDTDTPAWDSGVVSTVAPLGAEVGPLENGDDYRVAVRIGQLVNGAIHWSDWDTADFELDVDTSDVTSITETTSDSTGTIALSVARDVASEPWEFIEVQRTADDGSTWQYVRGAELAAASGNTFAVTDYEAPNGADVKYRARATWYDNGLPVVGPWFTTSTAVDWSSDDPWLKAVDDYGNLSVKFTLASRQPRITSAQAGVFNVRGRNPVVVLDSRSSSPTVLDVVTTTSAEADALEAALAGSDSFLVQYPASMDIDDAYVARLGDAELLWSEVADDVVRVWSIDVVEIDRPEDTGAGSL